MILIFHSITSSYILALQRTKNWQAVILQSAKQAKQECKMKEESGDVNNNNDLQRTGVSRQDANISCPI